mgnify:FL=1
MGPLHPFVVAPLSMLLLVLDFTLCVCFIILFFRVEERAMVLQTNNMEDAEQFRFNGQIYQLV